MVVVRRVERLEASPYTTQALISGKSEIEGAKILKRSLSYAKIEISIVFHAKKEIYEKSVTYKPAQSIPCHRIDHMTSTLQHKCSKSQSTSLLIQRSP